MKKFKLILPIFLLIVGLIFIFNSNKKSIYNNLQNAFLDYADNFFINKPVTINKIKSDLAGFNSSKLTYMREFHDNDTLLGCGYNSETNYLDSLSLEVRNKDINKVLSLSNYYNGHYGIFATIHSNNIDKQSDFLSYLYSDFNLAIIKDNKNDLGMYLNLVKLIKEKGYVNINQCKKSLNLKLELPPEEIDMSQTYKHGYFKHYTEGNYSIMTYNDIVIDVDLTLTQKLDSEYFIFLSMSNDYIDSEENRIKLFLVDRGNMDDVLNSSSTFTSSISIDPNYDKENSASNKGNFHKLYKYMFK